LPFEKYRLSYPVCRLISRHIPAEPIAEAMTLHVQGYASISVQASSCLAAGAISTVAMLQGKPRGHDFLRDTGLAFLSVDHHGQVTIQQTEPARHDQATTKIPSPLPEILEY